MSEDKKPALATLQNYWESLHQEYQADVKRNEGYVWTIQTAGSCSISNVFAKVNYELNLNCSHVGKTMFGVYHGSMSFKVDGDITGTKLLLLALGIRSKEDVNGWFRNDNFVMRLSPYSQKEDEGFADAFTQQPVTETDTSDNALTQAVTDSINGVINGILDSISVKKDPGSTKAVGLWYDWDTHMTEGDLGMFLKLNGGTLLWYVNGHSATDAQGSLLDVDASVWTPFSSTITERYDETIGSPFPYRIKVFDNYSVLFTLYNSKGGPVTADWLGKLDRIPVENTIVVNTR